LTDYLVCDNYPINKRFGHRREVHSIFPWLAIFLLGIIWHPLVYIGIGAVSHIFIDCLTVSGVPMLLPLSHKVFVIFSRKWRVKTGSIRGSFLIVGTEGNYGMAIFDGDRLWHIPPLMPLKVHIRCTDKRWPCHRIYGLKLAKKRVFFFDKKWHLAEEGSLIWGYAKDMIYRP